MASKFVLPGINKAKFGREIPPDALLVDNLETSLATTVDTSNGNIGRAIGDRYVKPEALAIFVHPGYLIGGPGMSIAIPGPHEEFFNSTFGICIGEKCLDGCCRPIRMQKVWRFLYLRKNIV